ncbi:MAG: hypothetical protein CMO55_09280, partial [Verrucomicrobiales bacterium]|nr:hypothetical protein [Verrucomicrobiales bacterium]
MPEKKIALVGDVIRDVLIPAENRSQLNQGKETDAEGQVGVARTIEIIGGTAFTHRVLKKLWEEENKGRANKAEEEKKDSWDEIVFDDLVTSAAAPHEIEGKAFHSTHWTLDSFPKKLGGKDHVYRVNERCVSVNSSREYILHDHVKETFEKEKKHPILVLNDYDRDLRQWFDGKLLEELNPEDKETYTEFPIRRILMLGNRLPTQALTQVKPFTKRKKNEGPKKEKNPENKRLDPFCEKEKLWHEIFSQLENDLAAKDDGTFNETISGKTVIITGIDRLRQDGAFVSKRKSWDRTIDDLCEEVVRCHALRNLAEFGHLFIRIGVTAVAHFYRDEKGEQHTRFYYDPAAPGTYFRDLGKQGNVFSIRSVLPAVLADAALEVVGKTNPHEIAYELGKAAKKSISLNQKIYEMGFGGSLSEVQEYAEIEKEPQGADNSADTTNEKDSYQKNALFRAIEECDERQLFNEANVPKAPFVLPWALLSGNMRADICPIDSDKPPLERSKIALQMKALEDLRRLRCARLIVHGGIDQVVNQRSNSPKPPSGKHIDWKKWYDPQKWHDRLKEELERERKSFTTSIENTGLGVRQGFEEIENPFIDEMSSERIVYSAKGAKPVSYKKKTVHKDIERSLNEINSRVGRDNYLPNSLTQRLRPDYEWDSISGRLKKLCNSLESYPFNFPVSKFGHLSVVGQRDIENFTNVWNRLTQYVAERDKKSRPLNFAVFGPPGTGKSFGIKQIARQLSDDFEEKTFNLSQFDDRSALNRAMLQISNIITRGKIPLIFFDEFDSENNGTELGWLRYFLEPMQDGLYQHPESEISVYPSVFIFAGGTKPTSEKFIEQLETHDPDKQARLASVKLRDFISRIAGFVDIPVINPEHDERGFARQQTLKERSTLPISSNTKVDGDLQLSIDGESNYNVTATFGGKKTSNPEEDSDPNAIGQ